MFYRNNQQNKIFQNISFQANKSIEKIIMKQNLKKIFHFYSFYKNLVYICS